MSTTTTPSVASAANQGLVIGVLGGACAPSWLNTLTSLAHPVPMPSFEVTPWDSSFGTSPCVQTTLPASWDSVYGSQYVSVVGSLVSILQGLPLMRDPSHNLRDHLVAISDGAMILRGIDEMGVFSTGCSATGTVGESTKGSVAMTSYQVAQTWASLPPPDNYTPAKAQTAYRNIFDGLLNIAAGVPHNVYGSQIEVTQTLDGSEGSDWPSIDANGVPLPPQTPPVAAVPMYVQILAQAAADARDCYSNGGTLSNGVTLLNCMSTSQTSQASAAASAVFGWPGLYNDSTSNPSGTYSGLAFAPVVLIVNAGALNGAG